jgi:hypothetical protein
MRPKMGNFNDWIIIKDELEGTQKEVINSFLRYHSNICLEKPRKSIRQLVFSPRFKCGIL